MECIRKTNESGSIIFWAMVHNKWIYFNLLHMVMFPVELIVSIVESDMIGIFGIIALAVAQPHMMLQPIKYKGLTQNTSLFHWQSLLVWIIYACFRLLSTNKKYKIGNWTFWGKLTFDNQPILFISTGILVVLSIINDILDFIAIYKWYYLKDRFIIRHDVTLKKYHDMDQLLDKTENVEWIMKKGVLIEN